MGSLFTIFLLFLRTPPKRPGNFINYKKIQRAFSPVNIFYSRTFIEVTHRKMAELVSCLLHHRITILLLIKEASHNKIKAFYLRSSLRLVFTNCEANVLKGNSFEYNFKSYFGTPASSVLFHPFVFNYASPWLSCFVFPSF